LRGTRPEKQKIPVYLRDAKPGDSPAIMIKYELADTWVVEGAAEWLLGTAAPRIRLSLRQVEGAAGTVALRMIDRLPLPLPQSRFVNASITECESEDNAVKAADRIPSFAREKVKVWPKVGIDPEFGQLTRVPLLVAEVCQCGAARKVKYRPIPPLRPLLLRLSDLPRLTVARVINARIREVAGRPRVPPRARAIRVTYKSCRELDQYSFVIDQDFSDDSAIAGPELLPVDYFASGNRARLLADCEGDKSAAGEVPLCVVDMAADNDIRNDCKQRGAADAVQSSDEAHALDLDKIVAWVCYECGRTWDRDIDDRPDSCPKCEGRDIAEMRSNDEPNGELPENEEDETPGILVEAARLDDLKTLAEEHEVGLESEVARDDDALAHPEEQDEDLEV